MLLVNIYLISSFLLFSNVFSASPTRSPSFSPTVLPTISPTEIASFQSASPWPQFRGPLYTNTGVSNYFNVPSGRVLRWSHQIVQQAGKSNSISSTPSIDSAGNLYFGSDNFNVYKVSSSGTTVWTYSTLGQIASSVSIGIDGSLYFGSIDSSFYSLTSYGSLRWSYATGAPIKNSPLLVGSSAYFGSDDGFLYKASTAGSLIWKLDIGGTSGGISFGSDNFIYFAN